MYLGLWPVLNDLLIVDDHRLSLVWDGICGFDRELLRQVSSMIAIHVIDLVGHGIITTFSISFCIYF